MRDPVSLASVEVASTGECVDRRASTTEKWAGRFGLKDCFGGSSEVGTKLRLVNHLPWLRYLG